MADKPGRFEPGTGEVNFASVADALKRLGYSGPIGLEAFAQSDDDAALMAFSEAFQECQARKTKVRVAT